MGRYNKQQVMTDAHKLYRNAYHRQGRSWSECMKAAWRWEKDAVKVREEKAAQLEAIIVASWATHNSHKEQKTTSFNQLSPEEVSYAMGYGRGNGFYCGD